MLRDVYVNLKVLGNLQPFERIQTRQKHFKIIRNSILPEWVYRFFDGSTRESDLQRIQDVCEIAMENVDSDRDNVLEHLQYAKLGLLSLKKTYETDTTMLARIDTLIQSLTKIEE